VHVASHAQDSSCHRRSSLCFSCLSSAPLGSVVFHLCFMLESFSIHAPSALVFTTTQCPGQLPIVWSLVSSISACRLTPVLTSNVRLWAMIFVPAARLVFPTPRLVACHRLLLNRASSWSRARFRSLSGVSVHSPPARSGFSRC
jgi:hypothetical protein